MVTLSWQRRFPNSPIGLIESTIGPNAVKAGNPTFTNIQNVLVTDQIDPTTGFAFPCATQGVNGCAPVEFGSLTRFVPGPFNDYEATGRLDFKLSSKDNFFGRYVYQKTFNGGVNFGNGIQVGDWQEHSWPEPADRLGLGAKLQQRLCEPGAFQLLAGQQLLRGAIVSELQFDESRLPVRPTWC